MPSRLALAAFALATIVASSAAEAGYRLCVRAGGFNSRHEPNVILSIGGTLFVAPNGGYWNPGYAHYDSCFDSAAHGDAKIGWSSPRYPCVGANIPEGQESEVWYVVDAAVADPSLGGRMPTCRRSQ
ncbi:hypothetical protein EDC65_1534 [Stella humosa]|uniref:Uncharacterized protein n=1 Tax=Stella humosa TaxID=94 RepID=A0A3N1M7S7_9PROT|nr:hypothetical protein [Stella humosa]ROP99747.1 hypothetical protein EDC65_1534 [Stella humosa]BBK31026.1 hypothetical protein STHU_16600 [Stella humosa]